MFSLLQTCPPHSSNTPSPVLETMAPLVLSLAQSESKQRFFERLGLDPHDRVHKRVYALMKVRTRSLQFALTALFDLHDL